MSFSKILIQIPALIRSNFNDLLRLFTPALTVAKVNKPKMPFALPINILNVSANFQRLE